MISLAFKMLVGNKASCVGVIFGIFLATLLISQQTAIFLGLVDRATRIVTDISEADVWVMDPATESEDKLRALPISYLDIVRGVPGVEWAVPLSESLIPIVTPDGRFDLAQIYGIDDATLIGAPTKMVTGSVRDLRKEGGIIVDIYSAKDSLAHVKPDGSKRPLEVGDELELNGKRALVVGTCKATQNFYPRPIIFASLPQFNKFSPGLSQKVSFILVKVGKNTNSKRVVELINTHKELRAFTRQDFKDRIRDFFLRTGILINFGLSVLLGIIIGFSIAGQIFYIMTLENVVYYALIRAIGGTKRMILHMILFQAFIVGIIGYALGMGVTVLWGLAIKDTTLAFLLPWQLLLFTGFIVLLICLFTAMLSIRKVYNTDPKMLMGT